MSPTGWFSQPVYIPGGDPEGMNEASLSYPGQLGIRFSYIDPPRAVSSGITGEGTPKAYKLVKTDSTMSVTPYNGAVAWFSNQAQNLVTTTVTTLGRGRVAGVFKNAVTPGYYTCIQVKGLGRVKLTDASAAATAAGEFVVPSATNAKAEVVAAGTAATYPPLGRGAGMLDVAAREALVDLDVAEVL
jgi:hypothetical protein